MGKAALWGRCNCCKAPLREHPYPDGHRCPSGCDCKDVIGKFDHGDCVVYFSYRKRIITQIRQNGHIVRVPRPLFDEIFSKLKSVCGQERKSKIGPFWGPEGPCYDNPI